MVAHTPDRRVEPLSHDEYRKLFDAIDDAVTVVEPIFNREGQCIDFLFGASNPALFRVTGLGDVEGKRAYEVVSYIEPEWLLRYGRVAKTGIPERFEYPVESLGRWLSAFVSRVGGDDSRKIVVVTSDITARKQAEAALRESEGRQAFLLKLSDTLRPLADPDTIQIEAMRVLVEHIGVARAEFWEFNASDPGYQTSAGAYAPGVAAFPQRVRSSDYGPVTEYLQAGRTYIIRDSETDPHLAKEDRANLLAIGIGAALGLPLIKEGRLVAALGVYSPTPRDWSQSDLALSGELVDRVWEAVLRARAELRLRESEERFAQFAKASAAGIWIRDAGTLAMEFASPAIGAIYGIDPATLGEVIEKWAALIVPDDRDIALEQIERAGRGEAVVHEFRIQRPSDHTFRWVRDSAFPLETNGHVQRLGGIAEDVTEAKLAVEHQAVLLAELQHRVRNIMAMIRSMTLRTADGAANVEDYCSLLEGRLMALARVQVLLTREANAGGSLRDIIEIEVRAQAHGDDQFELDGPNIRLSPKAVEVLTLAFHELATNALKYGAFSAPAGRLRVSWEAFEKQGKTWLALDWNETGAPPRGPSKRRGFGSDLIEGRVSYELGGTGKLTLEPEGAHCRMEFPLKDGESILETDAPTPTTIFGGTLDMSDAPDLTGQRVLVVEDAYYIAGDTAAALRGAGAEVLGPCPSEDATLDLLDSQTPTRAVLDLNLGGGGPKFEIARVLKERGVPFVFITGYDPDKIPPELDDVPMLQKPVSFRTIVEAVSQL